MSWEGLRASSQPPLDAQQAKGLPPGMVVLVDGEPVHFRPPTTRDTPALEPGEEMIWPVANHRPTILKGSSRATGCPEGVRNG